MATAVVDLPDPLESSPGAPASAPGGTDDILSEMVGDEIDRLLAESDAKPNKPLKLDETIDVAAAPGEPEKAFDLASINDKTLPKESALDGTSSTSLAQELDDILSSVDSLIEETHAATDDEPAETHADTPDDHAAEASAAVATVAATPPPTVAKSAAAEPAAPMASDAAPAEPSFEIDERAVAGAEALEPADPAAQESPDSCELPPLELPHAAESPEAAQADPAVAESTHSHWLGDMLVGLLEFINRPFAFCPSTLRDSLGKIGVATLINAAAILLYVRWIHLKH
jgi:hypothetical protein